LSEPRRRYLTTPIYYASGEPHIGHAYTTFLADTLARYYRQTGADVLFLTGTDEHGQKMQEEANRRGITPRELADDMASRFKAAWHGLEVSFDRFIRTTEAEHVAVVQAFFQQLWDRGQIYSDLYRGWYCVHDERYWTDKDLGPDQTCPDCNRPVREIEEKNYFFRMSAYQERLVQHIHDTPDWIVPTVRRNEILGFLQQPLEDLSVSRPKTRLTWGVTLPFDDEHVSYVWVDALINYLTASGAIDPSRPAEQQGFTDPAAGWWPADLHLMGKDILTTHAVYWPTLLMAVGLPVPRQILAHGWWVVGESKMSKSVGNVVDPLALREDFGTDAVRWFLLREMPTGDDATYTPERFLTRYEELANVLGNLASRVISMVGKYRGGEVPAAPDDGMAAQIADTVTAMEAAMDAYRVHEAFGAAMDLARQANGYVEAREPWAQAKDPALASDLDETLASLVRVLVVLCAVFQPVVPAKMEELASCLALDRIPSIQESLEILLAGRSLTKGPPLFPRVDLAG
jgi:methionyl-tRNA synthetase